MGQGKSNRDHGGGSVFVLLVILVLIVGIVAAAGLVLAVLNYNRENTTPVQVTLGGSGSGGYEEKYEDSGHGGGDRGYGGNGGDDYGAAPKGYGHYDDTVWSIQVGDNANRLAYVDRRTRQQRGYFVDVLHEVCQIAGKNCEIVHSDPRDCYFNGYPQSAILGRWLDGCFGFSVSADRVRSVKFTHSAIKAAGPVLLTLPGNPGGVDADNLNGLRIGVLNGWWANQYCIFASAGYDIDEEHVIGYEQNTDLNNIVEGLENGEVDAIFISGELGRVSDGTLQVIREFEPCLLGGDAVLTRKDSLLKHWWDPSFEKLVNSQAYRYICRDVDDPAVHGSLPGNSAEDTCVNQ